MRPFEYRAPERLEEVHSVLGEFGDEAKLLAGGQSLMILLRQGLVEPTVLVSLKRVPELEFIERVGPGFRLGAMVSYSGLTRTESLRNRFPPLATAAGSVGSVHIRNLGTIGGSLCHADPAGDVPTAMLVLDAELHASSGKVTLDHPIAEFFTGLFETRLGDAEVLESIWIPDQPAGATFGYRRFLFREGEYPLAVAACRLEWKGDMCTGARVAVGGGDAHPKRLPEVEEALQGTPVDGHARKAVADVLPSLLHPMPDVRGSAVWKSRVVAHLVGRAIEEAGRGTGEVDD